MPSTEINHFTSGESVKSVLQESYGFKVEKITKMDSYYNSNFLVKCSSPQGVEGKSKRYVVKIFDANADSFFDNAELQHVLMRHLTKNGIGCSYPLSTIAGETYVKVQQEDSNYLFQVLTFLPGISVHDANIGEAEMKQICFEAGKSLAKFHEASKTVQYNFKNSMPDFPWLPNNAFASMSRISYIEDEKMKEMVTKSLESFRGNYLPVLDKLPQGFVHGDFSDTNVVVDTSHDSAKNREGIKHWNYSGILDFEHAHHGYLVGDLGVSIAYFMTKIITVSGCDIIEAAAKQIQGYQEVRTLMPQEKDALIEVVRSRLAVSYISACFQCHIHPENKDFILAQARHIPLVFQELENATNSHINDVWFGNHGNK